ncbi:GPR139 [Branchiostoma lanceolatum]|uniref:GPR139 protein n=1 Tax=Branchiostoma lanceolatum TaxID=7740 RepID=A0A8J9ZA85_BRALA|nr:GPR139 [Branchiostoma lanceolatum]
MTPDEILNLAVKVFYPAIVIFGLPANALTLYILIRRRRRPSEAKSTPGLYLIALAVADSLVLIFIVFIETVVHFVILDRQVSFGGFCPFLITLDYGAHNASIWIIVVYTVERFIGVYFPIWKHKVSNAKTAKLTIAGVYVVSYLLALPHFFAETPTTVQDGNTTIYRCGYVENLSAEYRLGLIWGQSTLSYIIPYIVIIGFNGMIIYKLRNMRKIGPGLVRQMSEVTATEASTSIQPRVETSDSPHHSFLQKRLKEEIEAGAQKAGNSDDGGGSNSRDKSRVTTRVEIHPRPRSASSDNNDSNSDGDRKEALAPVETTSPGTQPDVSNSVATEPSSESRHFSPMIPRGKARPDSLRARVLKKTTTRKPATRSMHKPVVVLITISAMFMLLWFPRLVIFLIVRTHNVGRFDNFSFTVAIEVASMLGLLNSAINVFLYAYADSRFRNDLVSILTCGRR